MAKFNLKLSLLFIFLSLSFSYDEITPPLGYIFSTSLPADPSLSVDHYRGLITALVNLNPTIDSHSIALINTDLTFDILRPMISYLSRIQVYPQFLSPHAFYFDFLQSFPEQNHLHFSSKIFFRNNMENLLKSQEIFACSRLADPFRQDFVRFLEAYDIEVDFFNIHRIGFRKALLNHPTWCSLDVFSISGSFVSTFFQQLKELDESFRLYSKTVFDQEHRIYYHTLLLNLALWESFIEPRIIQTELDSHSEVILFSSSQNIRYDREFRENQFYCVITPIGFENNLIAIDLIVSSHSSHLCSVLGQFEIIKPIATFVEIGNDRLFSRSRPGVSGMTIMTQQKKSVDEDQLRHLEFLQYKSHEVLLHAYGASPSDISFPIIHSTISQRFQRVYYYRVNGCYSNNQSFYMMHDSISSLDSSCRQSIQSELGYTKDNVDIGTQFYELFRKLPTENLPCLISIHPGLVNSIQEENFNHFMTKLGLIPMNLVTSTDNLTVAVGTHCRKSIFQLLISLIEEKEITEKLLGKVNSGRSTTHRHQASRTFSSVNQSVGALGTRLVKNTPQNPELLKKGVAKESQVYQFNQNNPIGVIENILPVPLLDLLTGRLRHKINVNLGANSHFISFNTTLNSLSMPRSLVEHIILEYIAPLVVGTQEEAFKNGFIGAEWWIHSRSSDDPKEYHMDTAITWCRDNGWSADLLAACHFYPAVGSVNYLTDEGGPTVVFDQISSDFGLFPPLPQRVGVGFPRRNRMLLFKGNRYHGVMKHPTVHSSDNRMTLLVNYWKEKTAGETFTHVLEQERMYLEKGFELTLESATQDSETIDQYRRQKDIITDPNKVLPTSYLPYHVFVEDHDFREDIIEWKQQVIPPFYSKYISWIQSHPFHMTSLPSVIPSKCLFVAFPINMIQYMHPSLLEEMEEDLCATQMNYLQSAPVVIFHLSNSSVNELAEKHYSEYTLHNWPLWSVDKESNNIQIVVASLVEESRNWKKSMPGGWNSPNGLD